MTRTDNVTDLAQWKAEHPPLVRLLTIGAHCWQAYFRLMFAAQSAVITSAARILR